MQGDKNITCRRIARWFIAILIGMALLLVGCGDDDSGPAGDFQLASSNGPAPPGPAFDGRPAEYAAAWAAKELCSRVFIAGGDPSTTSKVEITLSGGLARGFSINSASVDIDHRAQSVTIDHPGDPTRTAVRAGSQGCVILPRASGRLHFEPLDVPWQGPPASDPWPLGETVPAPMTDVDLAELERALAVHLARDRTDIRAVVVVHEGQLLAEAYAPGYEADVPQRAWSVGKSFAATLVGRMVDRGYLDLDGPLPVPQWAMDERQAVTLRHMLNMSSGLDQDRLNGLDTFRPENEHSFVYFDGFDTLSDALEVPYGVPPGERWAYRNVNVVVATALAQQVAAHHGEDPRAFAIRELLEPLGMRNSTLESDAYGNFISSGQLFTTARDLARLGLVHLQGGVLGEQRVLSAEWVEFAAAPAPGASWYGAFWWRNEGGAIEPAPRDAYYAAGAFGQFVLVVPSLDLVITQLAFDPLNEFGNFSALVADVVPIIEKTSGR